MQLRKKRRNTKPKEGNYAPKSIERKEMRNGLKFFTREGGLEGSDIEEILTYAQENEHPQEKDGGILVSDVYVSKKDFLDVVKPFDIKEFKVSDDEKRII